MTNTTVSRVGYYSGEALTTADFQLEQDYHRHMREMLANGVLTAGILKGLEVTWAVADRNVTVQPGSALDRSGRLLILEEALPFSPTLVDGKQNFLTISYAEVSDAFVATAYGSGYKRVVEQAKIRCDEYFDPLGERVLLAVIDASGNQIQRIYYYYGQYMRLHVSAELQSIQFVSEGDSPAGPMAIAAGDQGLLLIEAPKIELRGAVQADSINAKKVTGNFEGTFKGDGTQLTLPPSTNYWVRDGNDIYYQAGNVAIGDDDTSVAHLTIRQHNSAPAIVATGLISLGEDGKTVVGYQTSFQSELKVGQVITYDFIPPQTATIVSVVSDTEVIIDKRMAVDLGPAAFSTQHGSTTTQGGAARIIADGTSLMCTGGTFPAALVAGDQIILSQSEENNAKMLRVVDIADDTHMTVLPMSPGLAAEEGPRLSAFSASPSMLFVAGGQNPVVADLPPALAVAQNGSRAPMPNSVGINVESGALDASYALNVQGACRVTRWPTDPTNAMLLLTVGATGAAPYQGLIVRDNGEAATVPKTVAINVDSVDPQYALDVNGKVRLASLDVSSSELDIGTLKVASEIDTDKIGPYTANGPIEVTGDLIIDKTIGGKSTGNGLPATLEIAGNVEVKQNATIDGNLNVSGAISGKLQNPLTGPLTVNGAFMVTNGSTTADGDLFVHGNLHVNGGLTTDLVHINKHNAQGDVVWEATDDGSLSMLGSLSIGTTPSDTNFKVSPDGQVDISAGGKLLVGNFFEADGNGEVNVKSNGNLLVDGDVTINSGGTLSGQGSFDISAGSSVKCFGAPLALMTKTPINFDGSSFKSITAQTDGFVILDLDPDLVVVASSQEVVATITGVGYSYQCRAAVNQISGTGRAGSSVMVPIPKGGSCDFVAVVNAAGSVQVNVSLTWIPFGIGGVS